MPILTTSPDDRGQGKRPAPELRPRVFILLVLLSVVIGAALTVATAVFGWWRYSRESWSVLNLTYFATDAGFVVDSDGRHWQWEKRHRTAATCYNFSRLSDASISAQSPPSDQVLKVLTSRYGKPRDCLAWKDLVEQKRYLWNFAQIERIDVGWPARSFTPQTAINDTTNSKIGGTVLWHGTDLQTGNMPDWVESLDLSGKLGTAYLPTSPLLPGVLISWGFWSVVAGSVLACPMAVRAARAAHRRRHGRCSACGYDLRGLAGGACPVCGGGGGRALVGGVAAAAR